MVNAKVYIGQTINTSKRWSQHLTAVKHKRPSQVIHHAMIKYGIDNFKFEIIACCLNQDNANWTEAEIIKQENSQITGYNISNGGSNAPRTETWKQLMSVKMKGRIVSMEVREKISNSLLGKYAGNKHPRYGVPHDETTKELIRKKRLIQVENLGLPWPVGSKHTADSRQKMSMTGKGKHKEHLNKHRRCKINMNIANQIRIEYSSDNTTYKNLSKKYGISPAVVCGIIKNTRWVQNK